MSYAGLAADISTLSASAGTPVTVAVSVVQSTLISKGFGVGSTGVDGVWGTNTSTALNQAAQFAFTTGSWSASGGNVTFSDSRDWAAIKALPNSSIITQPTTTTTASTHTTAPPPPGPAVPPMISTSPSTGFNWTPWLIGGGVLLAGAGAFLMFSGGKKKPTATVASKTKRNAHRRSRRNTRRRTRRAPSRNWTPTGRTEGYFVVGPRGQMIPGSGTLAGALRDLRRVGGQKKGYRIEVTQPSGARRALGR